MWKRKFVVSVLSGGTEKISENSVKIFGVPSVYPTIHPQLQGVDVDTGASFLGAHISIPKSLPTPM
jgi:hypothetical protein